MTAETLGTNARRASLAAFGWPYQGVTLSYNLIVGAERCHRAFSEPADDVSARARRVPKDLDERR
jgi:hypothetical protein